MIDKIACQKQVLLAGQIHIGTVGQLVAACILPEDLGIARELQMGQRLVENMVRATHVSVDNPELAGELQRRLA